MSIQDLIYKLMWDRRYVTVPEDWGVPPGMEVVILRDPTVKDRNDYLFWKEVEEVKSRKLNVPTEGSIFTDARAGGYWTDDDELILKEADSHIAYLESELDRKGFAARRRQIEAQIVNTKDKKDEVLAKENALKRQTAEYMAHEVSALKLLMRVACTVDNEPLWNTEEEYMECYNQYPYFIQYLLNSMLSEDSWDSKDLREVARAPEWRLLWTLQRENLPGMFNRPIGELNINQKLVVYWSRVYDSAFEGVDCPDEHILNDDDKFDDWLVSRDKERQEKSTAAKRPHASFRHQEQIVILDGDYIETCTCGTGHQKGVPLGRRTLHGEGCKFGVWRPYSEQEKEEVANQVYGRNNAHMRKHLDKEQDKVMRKGVVNEQNLRNQHSRKIMGANTNVRKLNR